jgi:hypothetical protein
MSEFDRLQKQVEDAADYAMRKVDGVIESTGELLTGASGRKIAGGAALGVAAAVFLPVSLLGGAVLGGGYAALRQIRRDEKSEAGE